MYLIADNFIKEKTKYERKIIDLIMYRCVNCGTEIEELYRKYSPNVLKLLKCVCYTNLFLFYNFKLYFNYILFFNYILTFFIRRKKCYKSMKYGL